MQAFFTPTNLRNLTIDLTSVFRSAFDKAGLYLNVDCPDLGRDVYVDTDMWEKVSVDKTTLSLFFTFFLPLLLAPRPLLALPARVILPMWILL